jgi:hypothetical protein
MTNPPPCFTPLVAGVDQLGQHRRRGHTFAVVVLKCREAVFEDVQGGYVSDGEWAEERKPEAKCGAHDSVDVLCFGDAFRHDVGGLLE